MQYLVHFVGLYIGQEPGEHPHYRGATVGCRGHMIQGLYPHRYSILPPLARLRLEYNLLNTIYYYIYTFYYSLRYIYCSRSSIIIFYTLYPFYYILVAIGHSNSYKPRFASRYQYLRQYRLPTSFIAIRVIDSYLLYSRAPNILFALLTYTLILLINPLVLLRYTISSSCKFEL